jgi:uncharacterized protein YukE
MQQVVISTYLSVSNTVHNMLSNTHSEIQKLQYNWLKMGK